MEGENLNTKTSENNDDAKSKEVTQNTNSNEGTKNYSQEEVDQIVKQSQEQAVAQALEQFKKEQAEKEDLAKLSEKDRLTKELEKAKEDNKRLENVMKHNEMLTQARSDFAKDGLSVPDDILDLVVSDTEEKTFTNMKAIKAFVDSLHSEWENKWAKGSTPKTSQNHTPTITKEQFDAMTVQEKMDLYQTNRNLYDQLAK